ncbi:MAG: hypothetical protein VKN72_24375, partial [Nostocales cyanobacterium 94392]|nr:hypothetical protein [Nostocales cyanobacterium 94392]
FRVQKNFLVSTSKNAPLLLYFYNGNIVQIFKAINIPIVKVLFLNSTIFPRPIDKYFFWKSLFSKKFTKE